MRRTETPEGRSVRLLRVGEQSVKLAIDAYYNAIKKKGGNDTWVTQLTLTFLFPD